jgi:hypothetical protein
MDTKSTGLSLTDWNWAVLMLNQALHGAISPNFRLVELGFEGGEWVVYIVLRQDDDVDREEADEICDQFSIFLEDVRDRISASAYAPIRPVVTVATARLDSLPSDSRRRVFKMRA